MKIGKLVFEWHNPLGDSNKPYAYRWRIDFWWFSLRVHKWLCSDDDRAYHSHPVNMVIWIVKGWYIDRYLVGDTAHSKVYQKRDIRIIKRDYRHWVDIQKTPTWTVVFTWGAPKRWSFWLIDSLKRKTRDKYFIEHKNHICK